MKLTPSKQPKSFAGSIWYFIWEEDSLLSWIVNIVLAFILIKFLVYPGLGFIVGTSYPVVAVVSGSMEHGMSLQGTSHVLCGNTYQQQISIDFDLYWQACGAWYEQHNISRDVFMAFPFRNGFNKGDIMVIMGADSQHIKRGDVVVFKSNTRVDPIIHRVVAIDHGVLTTKGDHNAISITGEELSIAPDRVIGRAALRIPYLGYLKIWVVEGIQYLQGVR
ncbi:signal peptidase I [Candidatus Woesearchaeota archaeon]|nr:signal peptidase I [Candidatus Woesearchaeota archaeon]